MSRPRTTATAVAVVVLLASLVFPVLSDPVATVDEQAVSSAPSSTTSVAAPTTSRAPVSTTTTTTTESPAVERLVEDLPPAPPAPAEPILVGDPTRGDMRFDPEADTLPASYTPAPTETVLRDLVYGPAEAQRLDLYLPSTADAAPVVLYLHSGGWIGGDKTGIPDFILRFVERGYAVASVGYHLAPEHPFPAAVIDVDRSIRWLKAHGAAEGTIDGDRMVLAGASAGGHLAAFAPAAADRYVSTDLPPELAQHDVSVAGVVSVVGPTDLVQLHDQPHVWARGITTAFAGCDPCSVEQLQVPTVMTHLHADLPPAYWIYGTEDLLVDLDHQGIAAAEAWAAHAGESSSWLDIVDGANHDLDESELNVRALDAFVDAAVGFEPPGG